MRTIEELVRPEVLRWENYQVQPVTGCKMDANESSFPLPESVLQAAIEWLKHEDLRIYPDTDCLELRKAIAGRYGLSVHEIICTVGSDQLIDYLSKAFLSEGDRIVVPRPSFSMYALSAEINHGSAVPFELTEDLRYPVDQILEICRQNRPKILYLCNPNNPTGGVIPEEDLRRLIEGTDAIVALDEAYAEFAGFDHAEWTKEYPRLIVLKTFSKAYGLAGLRIGYGIAQAPLIRVLDKVRAPYNLGTFPQILAREALKCPEYAERIRITASERDRIYAALAPYAGRNGFMIYPSRANFLYMRTGSAGIEEYMLARGLSVRFYGDAAGTIRVTVGRPEQNDALIEALRAWVTVQAADDKE